MPLNNTIFVHYQGRRRFVAFANIFTGAYAINPLNYNKIPIWIADYVLPNYGTGAIMAVPGHDERDYEFAQKYDLDIEYVLKNDETGVFTGDAVHINSEFLDGMKNQEAIETMICHLEKIKKGYRHTTYKMRDWELKGTEN